MPNSNHQYSIAIFLPSLEKGGAERRMILCAIGLKKRGFQVEVLVLRNHGAFAQTLLIAGIKIRNIDKKGRFDILGAAFRARKIFKAQNYSAVISCLPSANVFSILFKKVNPTAPLIWGLAAADMPMQEYSLWARFGARIQKRVSSYADKIIVNSNKGLQVALGQDYHKSKMVVVHNGIDTKQFFLDRSLGQKWREKFNILDEDKIKIAGNNKITTKNKDNAAKKVIGIVARLDPVKGLETFLDAAELAYEQDWYFIIFASGSSKYAQKLRAKIEAHSLFGKRLFLQENVKVDSSVYNTFDLTTISSISESFPNVMLESMACGVPVVATDVGDCRKVIQQMGKIVAVNDSAALYKAWQTQLNSDFGSIGAEVLREYIQSEFSIQGMICQFEDTLHDVLENSLEPKNHI